MTAFALPSVQPVINLASSVSKSPAANDADRGGFQQVLAKQVSKPKPEASAEAKPKTAAQNKLAASAKASGSDNAEQAKKEGAEDTASTDNTAVAEAMLNLAALAGADEFVIEKPAASAPLPLADQLVTQPGLMPVALPAQGLTAAQANKAKANSDVEALPASDLAPAMLSKAQTPARSHDIATDRELAANAGQPVPAAELMASATSTPALAEELPASPDFPKLVGGKEMQAVPVAAPAVLNAAQASVALNTHIEPRLGSKGWDQAVSQKVVWMVGAMEQSATLTLNPPDLGPLQVVIHVHNDQADATFVSDNPEVRQALQDNIATLRSMMSNSGIQLGDTNINAGNQAQQQFQQAARQQLANNAQSSQQAQLEAPAAKIYSGSGLVDTFA